MPNLFWLVCVLTVEKKIDVHTEHCCIRHGCKYGYDRLEEIEEERKKYPDLICTVTTGQLPQSFDCEDCGETKDAKLFFLKIVKSTNPLHKVGNFISEYGSDSFGQNSTWVLGDNERDSQIKRILSHESLKGITIKLVRFSEDDSFYLTNSD